MKKINLASFYNKINNFYDKIETAINKFALEKTKKTRYLMVLLASLFIMDYFLFCIHAEKNPFDIFPVFPVKDQRKVINIYLPDIDGKSLIKEAKKVSAIKDKKNYIQLLFQKVINGSEYENTAVIVPSQCYIRQIWLYDDICAIDVSFSFLKKNSSAIPGSESTFREALSKTIKENIDSIKEVILLDRGIPGKALWELNDKS